LKGVMPPRERNDDHVRLRLPMPDEILVSEIY
jgi:hypothetical protein